MMQTKIMQKIYVFILDLHKFSQNIISIATFSILYWLRNDFVERLMFPLVVLETYGSIIKFDKIFHKILYENFIYNRFYLFKTNSSSFFFIFKSKKFVYGNMPIYEIISEYITNASRVSEYSWNFQTCTTSVNEREFVLARFTYRYSRRPL